MRTAHPALHYKPRGAAFDLFKERHTEVLLSGPAGTGKSRGALEYLNRLAHQYPGMRGLIVRQVRASLTETGLVTWEQYVLHPNDPCRAGPSRGQRLSYRYANGSVVNVGGMDKPEKLMSSEYDIILFLEATEGKVEGWEMLCTRLRNGVLPWQQIVGDCNPGAPTHWLKQRCEAGTCKMLQSRHEDNPRLYDGTGWTPFGTTYLSKLDNLTGARKQRLRYGRWVQAEGAIYEEWDAARHVVDPFPIPPSWARFWSVDFGFTNPLVVQFWAEDPDGRLYLYRELYRTKTLVEDMSQMALKAAGATKGDWSKAEPKPTAVICDHDAEDRRTFERHTGLTTLAATKAVDGGIQLVAERLKVQGDGKPRLFILRGCRVNEDSELREASKPTCTEQEFDGYVWDDKTVKEKPLKVDDHGMDATRYLVAYRGRPGGWWAK